MYLLAGACLLPANSLPTPLPAGWGWQRQQQSLVSHTPAWPPHTPSLSQSAATAELDPEYRMALARTRQATAIHRAIGFLITGSRARCVGEA